MEYLVLGLNNYNFEDKDTGRKVIGLTAWVVAKSPLHEKGKDGFLPLKMTLDTKFNETIKSLPAIYDFDFETVPTTSGKFKTVVKDITYIEEHSLFSA